MRLTGVVVGAEIGVGLIKGDDGNFYAFSDFDAMTNRAYKFAAGTRVVFSPSECGPAAVDIVPAKEEPPNRDFLEVSPLDPRGLFVKIASIFLT